MASKAQGYFAHLTCNGDKEKAGALLASLKKGVEPFKEDTWLEFKSGDDWGECLHKQVAKCAKCGVTPQTPDEKIKAVWAELVGQFGNTEGGVVVWGVHAFLQEGEDKVWENRLVPKPHLLKERLDALILYVTNPPIEGIETVAILAPGNSKKGFVVCYIPQGKQRPYRTLFSQYNYWMRAGSNGIEAPRDFLRLLFSPIKTFKVKITVSSMARGFHISILNVGRYTLKDAFVLLSSKETELGTYGKDERNLEKTGTHVEPELRRRLHPSIGTSFFVVAVGWPDQVTVKFVVGAEDCPKMEATKVLNAKANDPMEFELVSDSSYNE